MQVRSLEEGFQGSWHSAIVIACAHLQRHVKYCHLLGDDGSTPLSEIVTVSSHVDGIISGYQNYRGTIRPLPPHINFSRDELTYGMCVDVYHEDAWWEGVLFDRQDGATKRRVFFPDLGDEMDVDVNYLRVTQDWNEVTEEWQPRAKWFFLELIEEYKRKYFLSVSVKQIWYDVRDKKDFGEIKEWTSPEKPIWEQLVLEVIVDTYGVFLGELLQLAMEIPEPIIGDDKPEHCPQAVFEYVRLMAEDAPEINLGSHRQKAKKQLLALGWTVKYKRFNPERKKNGVWVCYVSPTGRNYNSLVRACRGCMKQGLLDRRVSFAAIKSPSVSRLKRQKVPGTLNKSRNVPCSGELVRGRLYNKRARQVPFRSLSYRAPRTVLSWLIDNNVVLPRTRVSYYGRNDHGPMKQGWITHDGIRCKCCQNVFNLSGFEAHAGSKLHRPSANIFLDDGRSLLECQKQILYDRMPGNIKCDSHQGENDSICSVCHYGGELVLCDRCPSAFHTYCLNLRVKLFIYINSNT